MKGLERSRSIPQKLDIMKSAIYQNDLVENKDGLYRNQSRSQFQYEEKNKRSLGGRYNDEEEMRDKRGKSMFYGFAEGY